MCGMEDATGLLRMIYLYLVDCFIYYNTSFCIIFELLYGGVNTIFVKKTGELCVCSVP